MSIHVLPGRIRLRPSVLLDDQVITIITERIRRIVPTVKLVHSAASGSLLITFEEKALTANVLALLGPWPEQEVRRRTARSNLRYLPSSRTAKRGMAAALLAALGLVAMGRETGHGLSGGLFLLFLSRHLWIYRRRLLL